MDCKILPIPYCTLLARGLNYRPKLVTDGIETLRACIHRADTVLQKVRGFRGRTVQVDKVRESFRNAINRLIRTVNRGSVLQQLTRAAAPVLRHLVVFSTIDYRTETITECIKTALKQHYPRLPLP